MLGPEFGSYFPGRLHVWTYSEINLQLVIAKALRRLEAANREKSNSSNSIHAKTTSCRCCFKNAQLLRWRIRLVVYHVVRPSDELPIGTASLV